MHLLTWKPLYAIIFIEKPIFYFVARFQSIPLVSFSYTSLSLVPEDWGLTISRTIRFVRKAQLEQGYFPPAFPLQINNMGRKIEKIFGKDHSSGLMLQFSSLRFNHHLLKSDMCLLNKLTGLPGPPQPSQTPQSSPTSFNRAGKWRNKWSHHYENHAAVSSSK